MNQPTAKRKFLAVVCLALSTSAANVLADGAVLNLYSARHYQSDEALYANFTKQTGIKVNRIEGKAQELIERISNEGANSPADVFITADAASLAVAAARGIFAPVRSTVLETRIPAHLRSEQWFAFSTGGGMVKSSKNRDAAIRFLEYLASDEAQRYLAHGNNEWPAVPNVAVNNEELAEMGKFKADNLPIGKLAQQLSAAQKLLDRAGYR